MKSASVADLRNKFASVSRWIHEGESVTIKKRGKPFAVLTPAGPSTKAPDHWPSFGDRLERAFPDGPKKGMRSEELLDLMRGDY